MRGTVVVAPRLVAHGVANYDLRLSKGVDVKNVQSPEFMIRLATKASPLSFLGQLSVPRHRFQERAAQALILDHGGALL